MKMCKCGSLELWKHGNALLGILLTAVAYSAEVSVDEAREAVQGWARLREALGEQFTAPIGGVETYKGEDGVGAFHVVSFEGGGFAVTSGDTEVTPVLAYSHEGEFVASEDNPLWCLLVQDVASRTMMLEECENVQVCKYENMKTANEEEAEEEASAAKGEKAPSANASAWARLRAAADKPVTKAGYTSQSSVADLRVGPLCKTRWSQDNVKGYKCYNYYTPSNYVCGCVATAFAQVMKFFEWPKEKVEVGNHWYTRTVTPPNASAITWRMGVNPDTDEKFPDLDPVFSGPAFGGPYDWDNMPDNPASADELTEVQRQAIGLLTRDCGISVRTRYGRDGSAASGYACKIRLLDQFDYANAELIQMKGSNAAEWARKAMLASFDLGSPCIVAIGHRANGKVGGHEVVGDGYGYADGRLYVHFNFGWGNNGATAWYTPAEKDEGILSTINGIVYNIWTPGMCKDSGCSIVSGRVLDEDGEPVSGQTVTAKDKKTGTTFSATTNDKGIYALLLPPETSYEIKAESLECSARTTRRVERCVSNRVNEKVGGAISYFYRMGETVGNQPGVDLRLSAEAAVDDKWLDERAAACEWTGEWSKSVKYGDDGRAYLDGVDNEVAFTAYNASTGNVVTVETKMQFFPNKWEYEPDANVQAAVRLSTNGCFQVWTRGAWLDVAADGVTPVSGEEYTIRTTFDYTACTYSVEVNDSALELQLETPTRSFPLATVTDRVSGIAFAGDTYLTSMVGDCRLEIVGEFATNEVVMLKDNASFILNTAKAAWLNKLGAKPAVEGKLSGMALDDVTNAYLLNLDIASLDDVDGSYSFEITDIDVGDTSVTVAVTLTRTGKVEQKINGALKFYGAATLAEFKTSASPLGMVTLSDEGGDFSDGDTTTAEIPLDGETPPAFFKATIEE